VFDWRNDIIINPNWVPGSDLDPNGDNWRDCGWDGVCPEDAGYDSKDPNNTESNGVWDSNEGFEESGQYNFDIITGTGEYFNDLGNEISDESAEYYFDGDSDGEYDLDEPFEDRNCNGIWDDEEDGDEGNGIFDDDESYIPLPSSPSSSPSHIPLQFLSSKGSSKSYSPSLSPSK
jgi:hypothetical protein